jgi:putative endopeptidase
MKQINKGVAGFLGLAVMLASCAGEGGKNEGKEKKEDILVANMDTTVNPADDFFDYAQGAWVKRTNIPAEETSWGIGQLVQAEIYERKKAINDEALKKNAKSGTDQQIGDFWYSGMDTASIEKEGINPLRPELNKIEAIRTPQDVMAVAAYLHTIGVGAFYSEGVGQDSKRSDVMAYYLNQGGLGMPNRDYYFNTDARTAKIRAAYPRYISKLFQLMGTESTAADAKAAAIVALETKLAGSSRKLADLRDPEANYNKMAIAGLKSVSPTIDWPVYMQQMGVKSVDSVIVGQPEFYKTLDKIVSTENIQTLKDYLSFQLVSSYADFLSTPFTDADFEFYNKTIKGAEVQRPRWKRVLDAEEGIMGEALGKLFAAEYFDAKAKKRYEDMVENVRTAYRLRMEKLDWMTDSTKKKALYKLSTITKKVGYPDKWKDFSAMKVDRGSYVRNYINAKLWWNNYDMSKLGKPVNKDEWDMTPQTYNAYYNSSNNEIVLPAGIFTVPGYRDEELDDALVYGYAAASTIGHEITHGFDDEGRQFDAKGNLLEWWSPVDKQQFTARATLLEQQFSGMVVLDSMKINGKATLGENLADLGGILIGLDAFKQTEAYKKGDKINGLTPLQRYFLGYALGWMYKMRPEYMANLILTDVHSPAKYRVNGPMPNVPEFYEAFNVKPGDRMYLPDSLRVRLW